MINNSNNGVVVGAGWLGQPLANSLEADGWQVVRTSRQAQNKPNWAQFNLEKGICEVDMPHAVWFFCMPPGRTVEAQRAYSHYLTESLALAKAQQAKRFVFCSTTGVYPTKAQTYTELSAFEASAEKQSRLLESEQQVADSGLHYVIVRLGGLIGEKRHPGRFLSGKTLSSSANALVNMLHQDDAVMGLSFIATHNLTSSIVNLVTPHHPTKQAFYAEATKLLAVDGVSFEKSNLEERIISSDLLVEQGFQFKYDNLFKALKHC